jgi:hypothetical protein
MIPYQYQEAGPIPQAGTPTAPPPSDAARAREPGDKLVMVVVGRDGANS